MQPINRAIIIVLDSVGIGELPDAADYGDVGADTLGNIAREVGGLDLPNLEALGLGKIRNLSGVNAGLTAAGVYGKMAEASAGKDTTTGHWELAGLISSQPFPTYPEGFPEEVIKEFQEKTGYGALGNKPASGTVIIEELIEEHLETGDPIVYTSADSVFQVAAHEEIIPVPELYEICQTAREILTGEHGVARVIARPFIGEPGDLSRTDRRKDFSLAPPDKTLLNILEDDGQDVLAVGKINDIFTDSGITDYNHVIDNMECVDATLDYLRQDNRGLIFSNLVEYDMVYGHRRDVKGYYQALQDFDRRLPEILDSLRDDDMLAITADHGCDPTFKGTDHTREYVPLLLIGSKIREDLDLGIRETFADLAATIADILQVEPTIDGTSFKDEILL